MASMVPAVAAVLGVCVGAGLQFVFGQLLERRKQFLALRSQAYVDFVKAAAAVAHAQRAKDAANAAAALEALTEAKVRITIYGARPVVQALASFSSSNQNLSTFEGQRSFLAVVHAMRVDAAGKRGRLSTGVLATILIDRATLELSDDSLR